MTKTRDAWQLIACCTLDVDVNPDGLHHYDSHLSDWAEGDPTWQGGKGKRIIGAINYLAAKRCNTMSFLTYNSGGDGDDVWPFAVRRSFFEYDCSKLDQWSIALTHAQAKGELPETEQEHSKILSQGIYTPTRITAIVYHLPGEIS